MSLQAISSSEARCLARVRLPDQSEQDVELARADGGQLVAALVDGAVWRAPAVHLDFSQGATPRVSWAEREQPSLAASLEIVSKVCEVLARAAQPERDALPIEVELSDDVSMPRAKPRKLVLATAMVAVAVLVPVAVHAVARADREQMSSPAPVAPPMNPAVILAGRPTIVPISKREPEPEPVPVPVPEVSRARIRHHRHHGIRLLRSTVAHRVRGIEPGTGVVALRTAAGLEVAVDGNWVGMTPVHPIALSEGSHTLELRRTGKRAETLELGVTDGDKTTLYLQVE